MDSLVSADWVAEHLDDPDLRVLFVAVNIDPATGPVAAASEFAAGHIPGAVLADLPGKLSDPNSPLPLMMPPAESFARAMENLGVGDGARVVIYDSGGNAWAARLWWMLHAVGFDEAAILDGGWHRWRQLGHPIVRETAPVERAEFVIRDQRRVFADKDEVLAALGNGNTCIINALDAAQHSGDEPFFGIRGHIPGATNVPAFQLVDPDTRGYLPLDVLRERFAAALEADHVITYCGGGIASSSDAFILRRLGHPSVSVYDGSLVEWGMDAKLPLEVDVEL